jgi:hypothetical protein
MSAIWLASLISVDHAGTGSAQCTDHAFNFPSSNVSTQQQYLRYVKVTHQSLLDKVS